MKASLINHPYQLAVPENPTIYKPKGCPVCGGTGYKGRAGIFEGIIMDEAVEEAVIRDPREHVILEAAKPQKIPSMLEDGIEKVLLGTTSLSELERVVELPLPDALDKVPEKKAEPADDDFYSHVV
jgi:general secretion pathway protein E